MRDYKKLNIWKVSDELVYKVYKVRDKYPKEELYGIVSQLTRAVVSVPTSIAEGSSRESNKDFLRFLHIAMGSLKETEYLIYLSRRLGYLDQETAQDIERHIDSLAKMLFRFIEGVKVNL